MTWPRAITNEEELEQATLRLAEHKTEAGRLRKLIADYLVDQAVEKASIKLANASHRPRGVTKQRRSNPRGHSDPRGHSNPKGRRCQPPRNQLNLEQSDVSMGENSAPLSPMDIEPRFDFSFRALKRRALNAEEDFRLQTEANEGLRAVAKKTGVNYMALSAFVRSDEVHAFAWDFLRNRRGGGGTCVLASFYAVETREREGAWCMLWSMQERLRWLRRQVEAGHYGQYGVQANATGNAEQFDPSPWVDDRDDGIPHDKRHFTLADHITRFVLLCENFRLMSGREEWDNAHFGYPWKRLEIYKAVLLLFIRKDARDRAREALERQGPYRDSSMGDLSSTPPSQRVRGLKPHRPINVEDEDIYN